MDRSTTWRVRVDTTTNWAIITSGTVVSFVLGSARRPHAVLLLAMVFTLAFLVIESRRLRYYDLWGSWVRLLEIEYFSRILREDKVTVNELWQQLMVRDMAYPHFKTTSFQLLGQRLYANYLAIYLFLLLSWLVKLFLEPHFDPLTYRPDTFIDRAAIGPIPGWFIMTVVLCFYAALFLIVLVTRRLDDVSVEILSGERILQKLISPSQQAVGRRRKEAEMLAHAINDAHHPDIFD